MGLSVGSQNKDTFSLAWYAPVTTLQKTVISEVALSLPWVLHTPMREGMH